MKYEAVAQFTVSGSKVKSATELLERYGIDYVILDSTGGVLQTPTADIVIIKPAPTEMTPARLFSFMMKFDEMVRVGKETHTLTPAQIDMAKSCDKVKLLKCLDEVWYNAKVAYVKLVAMIAQAYTIAESKPDITEPDKHVDAQAPTNAFSRFLEAISADDKDQLLMSVYSLYTEDEFMKAMTQCSERSKYEQATGDDDKTEKKKDDKKEEDKS